MVWPFARRSPRPKRHNPPQLEGLMRDQLNELKAIRNLVGALGGTMGTCETHLGQLVAMAKGLAPAVMATATIPSSGDVALQHIAKSLAEIAEELAKDAPDAPEEGG